MVIIGLVLIAAAAAVGIEITAMNNISIDIDAFNQVYATSAAAVFVAGVVTALVGAIGVMLVRDGLVRRRQLRRERMVEEERHQRHVAALEEEHAALHRSDSRERADANLDLRDEEVARQRERDREHHVTSF